MNRPQCRSAVCALLSAFAALGGVGGFRSVASGAEEPKLAEVRFIQEWGGEGDGPGEFDFPVDIAITPDDVILVTDHYGDKVKKFDTEGKPLGEIAVGTGPGGIALDAGGRLYVTHFAAAGRSNKETVDRVTVHSPGGELLHAWGQRGTGDGEFNCPGGIAVGKDGRVYVADETNHRIQVFDGEGKFLLKWGEYGSEPGQFGGKDSVYSRTGGPQFVALDAAGNVWTTEGLNDRIQEFTADGKFLKAWGSSEDKPGAFGGNFSWPEGKASRLHGPVTLEFDVQGKLWVAAVSGRIQRFSPEGVFQGGLTAGEGEGPGQFRAPHGIALDSKGMLYVIDAFNRRVQKFEVRD